MKRIILTLLPLITMVACTSNQAMTEQQSKDSTVGNGALLNATPDISIGAVEFTNNIVNNDDYISKRLGKTIELKGITCGSSEVVDKTEVYLYGNDGDLHWNGQYECCRFSFKLANPEDAKQLPGYDGTTKNIHAKITITGVLSNYRDKDFTPPYASESVILKEYLFENCRFTVEPEITVQQTNTDNTPAGSVQPEQQEKGPTQTGEIMVDTAFVYYIQDTTAKSGDIIPKGIFVMYNSIKGSRFNSITYYAKNRTIEGFVLKSDMGQ